MSVTLVCACLSNTEATERTEAQGPKRLGWSSYFDTIAQVTASSNKTRTLTAEVQGGTHSSAGLVLPEAGVAGSDEIEEASSDPRLGCLSPRSRLTPPALARLECVREGEVRVSVASAVSVLERLRSRRDSSSAFTTTSLHSSGERTSRATLW